MHDPTALFSGIRSRLGEALRPPYRGAIPLPDGWDALWKLHDGQRPNTEGVFDGYVYLPVEGDVDSVVASREELAAQGLGDWFPLAKDFAGGFLAIDPEGRCWEVGVGPAPALIAADLAAFVELQLAQLPGSTDARGSRAVELQIPEDWAVGEALPLIDGAELVRLGAEALGLEAALLDPEMWIVAVRFADAACEVSIARPDVGSLGSTRGVFYASPPPERVRVTIDLDTPDDLNRFSPVVGPQSLIALHHYEEAVRCAADQDWLPAVYAHSWGPGVVQRFLDAPEERYARQTRAECEEAIAIARAALGLPGDPDHPSERMRLIATWGLVQHGSLDDAERAIQQGGPKHPALWKLLSADLAAARGLSREARAILAALPLGELAWSTPLEPEELASLFERRHPAAPAPAPPSPLLIDGEQSNEWVSPRHVRVRLTPTEAMVGKTVILQERGFAVRLPAGAGHGLSIHQDVRGEQIKVEAWIESNNAQLTFDRWDAVARCRHGEVVEGPYGPVDVAPGTALVPDGGLRRPNGERGALRIEWC